MVKEILDKKHNPRKNAARTEQLMDFYGREGEKLKSL
jgi:hypothetical protein